MAFDFNNLDNDNNKDLTSAFSMPDIVSSFDTISNFYTIIDNANDFKKCIFNYIGNDVDYKKYVIKIGDLDIKNFEKIDEFYDESNIEAHFYLTPQQYNKIAKNPKYSQDPKFLAFCSLFIDTFDIFELIVHGNYNVDIDKDDWDVGYQGGPTITDYSCTRVEIDDIQSSKTILLYDVIYPKTYKVYDSNLRKFITKVDHSKAQNEDIGSSFEPWIALMMRNVSVNLDMFNYDFFDD